MEPAKTKHPFSEDPLPVFNKRLFKANAGIVITEEAAKVLQKSPDEDRTPRESHAIRPVINGLKEIHKGLQYIKEALSRVLVYEKYDYDAIITKEETESSVPCLYILYGSVEAEYQVTNTDSQGKNSSTTIFYTHVAGEYLGLVSSDGEQFDLPSPDSIRTLEVCEFLRINRERFHSTVKMVQSLYIQEIQNYVHMSNLFDTFSGEEKGKIVHQMAKQEFPPGHVIVNQDEMSDHVFFVASGRCQYYRQVYIPEARRSEIVKLGQAESGDFFGESSVLNGGTCFCSVASIGPVTCYLINKWAIKHNEAFLDMLRTNRPEFCLDHEIKYHIRDNDHWQSYKRETVTKLLGNCGKDSLVISKSRVPSPLMRSIDFGDTSRHHTRLAFTRQDSFPGAPRMVSPLFYMPNRRESSAQSVPKLHYPGNTAAVVKAVLLLNSTKERPEQSRRRMSSILLKPMTAPERRRHGNKESTNQRPRTMPDITAQRKIHRAHDLKRNSAKKLHSAVVREKRRKTPSRKKKTEETKQDSIKSDESLAVDGGVKKVPAFAIAEPSLVSRPVCVEIINTGVPGKKPLANYKRFEPSMFGVLDEFDHSEEARARQRQEEERLNQLRSTWTVSLSAKKWQHKVERVIRPESPQLEQGSPLIVVEDWSEHHSEDGYVSPTLPDRPSRAVTPSLADVVEESDDDLRRIEREDKEMEGQPQVTWTTEIHEARKESELNVKTLREDLEKLRLELEKANIPIPDNNHRQPAHASGSRIESRTPSASKGIRKITFKQVVEKYLKTNRKNFLLNAAVSAFQQAPEDKAPYTWKAGHHVRFPTPPPAPMQPRSRRQSRTGRNSVQSPFERPRAESDCGHHVTTSPSPRPNQRKSSSANQLLLRRINQGERVTAVGSVSG